MSFIISWFGPPGVFFLADCSCGFLLKGPAMDKCFRLGKQPILGSLRKYVSGS